jgi:hypothetical protein
MYGSVRIVSIGIRQYLMIIGRWIFIIMLSGTVLSVGVITILGLNLKFCLSQRREVMSIIEGGIKIFFIDLQSENKIV